MNQPRNYDPSKLREKWAKEWAESHGYKGYPGGWIYSDASDASGAPEVAVCQGWSAFWRKFRLHMLNAQVMKVTTLLTFQELVYEQHRGPRLDLGRDWHNVILADEYNTAQEKRGVPHRATCWNLPKGLMAWQIKRLAPEINPN